MSMVKADGIEAVFEGTDKRTGKTYTYARPVQFWYDGGNGQVGMYLDDRGELLYAEGRSNFKGFRRIDTAPVVAAIPADDLYAAYRDDDGTLNRASVPAILVTADGELLVRELDSDGAGYNVPTDTANFVGYWRKSWGDEPIDWQPETGVTLEEQRPHAEEYAGGTKKQGTFFGASGASPPGDEE